MEEENPFREFIESLPQLDGFGEGADAKALDEVLAAWIAKYHPKGFDFDYKRRDLAIAIIKKKRRNSRHGSNISFQAVSGRRY